MRWAGVVFGPAAAALPRTRLADAVLEAARQARAQAAREALAAAGRCSGRAGGAAAAARPAPRARPALVAVSTGFRVDPDVLDVLRQPG